MAEDKSTENQEKPTENKKTKEKEQTQKTSDKQENVSQDATKKAAEKPSKPEPAAADSPPAGPGFDSEEEDDLEPLIKEFIESKDAIQSMLVMFRKLKQAGIVDFIDQLSQDYLPSDVEFIGKFLSSREFTYGILKSANTLLGLMYALSRESTSDALKALMFDSEGMIDSMVSGAKNPERMSMMRLFAMTKDPEIASGLTAALNMLKELGKSLQKVKND